MIIFTTVGPLQEYLLKQKKSGKKIGFTPTMGALHNGHLSLVETAQKHCPVTVVSIFVNPTQFNNAQDFALYPSTIEHDCILLEKAGVNILFLPSVAEVYPNGTTLQKHYDLGELENVLDGKYRPGHFQGVCQVVERLLNIVQPDELFLGQKDLQQCMVLKRLTTLMKADLQLTIVPTLRETSGLAMSSRNLRLDAAQLQQATQIYQQLLFIQQNIATTNILELKQKATQALLDNGFNKVDYVEIVDHNLQAVKNYNRRRPISILIAAFLGDVRLIDNVMINGTIEVRNQHDIEIPISSNHPNQ
jgi:pantoate--beta-alanine ligase